MFKKFLGLTMALLLGVGTSWAEDSYVQLTSIAGIDESADYVLGIDGTGFHESGTSSWGVCSKTKALMYKLIKAADGNSFKAHTTIDGKDYYLTVPTTNNFTMAESSTAGNTDLIIGTTQVSGTNYAVANKGTTARHLRINGTSGLRSYAGTTGNMAFFYKVVSDGPVLQSIAISGDAAKKEYYAGDEFDPTGLVVTATYDKEPLTKIVTDDVTWAFNPETLTEGLTSVSVTATYSGKTSAAYTVSGLTVEAAFSYQFTQKFKDIPGFSDWTTSYAAKTATYTDVKVDFASVNRSTTTVTDVPVTKGGDVEFIITSADKAVTAIKFVCKQWSTKAQTITLKYSTDGGTTYAAFNPAVTSTDFTIEAKDVPAGTNAVKMSFSSTSNQVGIVSVSYNLEEFILPKNPVTLATCENGSVGASATVDVEQNTEVTLSNEPATGYKFVAYDVYKTDDNTTKVTVTDGKFKMPEYAVTVSATFEEIKVLDHIELNTEAVTKEFWRGETFNYTGLVVTAYYTNSDPATVTPASVSTPTMTLLGENQTITVSYTEGGITKEATYTIVVKTIANTEKTAYTVAEARELINAKKDLSTKVYVKGIVSVIHEAWSTQYNNITYGISDDGVEEESSFKLYRCVTNGAKVGNEVIAYGELYKHTDGTYELKAGCTLVSIITTPKNQLAATGAAAWENMTDDDTKSMYMDGEYLITKTAIGKHSTICLPYNCTVEGAIVYAYQTRTNEGLVYEVGGNSVAAGVAYIYFATADQQTWSRTGAEEAVDVTVDANQPLVGTYADFDLTAGDYFLHRGEYNDEFCIAGDFIYAPTFRAYIPKDKMPGIASAAVRIVFPTYNPNVTGVENTECTMHSAKCIVNGRLVIKHGAKAFNANGAILK